MHIKGKVVFVTGANGGIGKALVQALLDRGAEKIYAAARLTSESNHVALAPTKIFPVNLDITDAAQVEAAAKQCRDVDILINNAGINLSTSLMSPAGTDAARREMEVNYFGTLAMCRAFAPVLISRGGGVIACVSSIIGMVNMPINGTYSASKAALHSMLQGVRAELTSQNIKVVGIYPGPVDTRMTKGQEMPKATPAQVADNIITGIENGDEDIFPDPMSQDVHAMLLKDAKQVEKQFAGMLP